MIQTETTSRIALQREDTVEEGTVHYRAPCGCLVILKPFNEAWIERCRVHDRAPAMRMALQGLISQVNDIDLLGWLDDFIVDCGDNAVVEIVAPAEDAIAGMEENGDGK